jgi:hypothetical protein
MTTDTKAPSLREALEHVRDFIDGKVSTSPDEICAVINAALATPTPTEARERIARVIDPTAKFSDIEGVQWSRFEIARRNDVRAKADAILALAPDAATIRAAHFEEAAKIALGDIVSMAETSPYFSDWRGITMKVVGLHLAPDGSTWADVIEGEQRHRGNGRYDGETTDIDTTHLDVIERRRHQKRGWKIMTENPWRCCGCGMAASGEVKPCACVTMCGARYDDGKRQFVVFMSATEARRLELSKLIKDRILGVKPDDQDVVLEDADWGDIVAALEGRTP